MMQICLSIFYNLYNKILYKSFIMITIIKTNYELIKIKIV